MKKIISGGTGEFTDKKSRFIANIYHIEDEDMAVKIIEQLRKKYWDARHNCYAYVLGRMCAGFWLRKKYRDFQMMVSRQVQQVSRYWR